MNFYQRVSLEDPLGHVTTASDMMVFGESRVQLCIGCHSATATANTLTTQYMVRFSHLTVQLPERETRRRNYTAVCIRFLLSFWGKVLVILYIKHVNNLNTTK